MVYQTAFLFRFEASPLLYGFVFCGTVCSYNFHWYLTPPSQPYTSTKLLWNSSNRKVHLLLVIAAGCGAAFLALCLLQHWQWLCVTAFVTFLYSAPKMEHPLTVWLRKFAIAKTFFLAFAWTHVTCILPFLFNHTRFTAGEILFVVERFFLIYTICLLFDFRDAEADKAEGIKSMVTDLSPQGFRLMFYGSGFVFLLATALLLRYFPATAIAALAIPGGIVMGLYSLSNRNHSDYLYYFVLDGLMMFSLPLLLLAKFAA